MRYSGPCSLPAATATTSLPSPRTFFVAATTDAAAPFLVAKINGTQVNLDLSMLLVTTWSCFSLLCPSYGSMWILVKHGKCNQGSRAMSCWCCTCRPE